ncbi:MAG: hypothetical protein ACRDG3_12215 [Tepidiformaceae bacterium]
MSVLGIVILVLIAAACGIVGQMIAGYSLGGLVISVLIGFIGAWIGLWIANNFDLPQLYSITVDDRTFPIVWAIVGSAILAAVVGLVANPRRA